MIRPLQQLIDALRLELQQYGDLLAQFDELPSLTRRYVQPDDGWDFEARAEALLLARQSRERWQLQLAWAAEKPDASSFEELIPVLPKNYRPLVTALVAENESLWRRIGDRLSGEFAWLDRARAISQQSLARMFDTGSSGAPGSISPTSVSA